MKFSGIVDAQTASALEVAWLNAALEPASGFGRRAYVEKEPYRAGDERAAQQRASAIAEAAGSLTPQQVEAMREALGNAPDPLTAVSRAGMGETLDDAQFFELLRFLDAMGRVEMLEIPPEVARLHETLARGRSGTFGFYLADEFDDVLASDRLRADRAQAEFDAAYGRLAQRAAALLGRADLPPGEFIVMRDAVAAIPAGVRVVREAPTYVLCELDLDEEALSILERRDEAAASVAARELAARGRISAAIRECAPQLQSLLAGAAEADVFLSAVLFTQTYACVPAEVVGARGIGFRDASYLPLRAQLQAQGRSYAPISLELSRGAVITGPNMGGKSAALRTCGFIALLAAFGIPVPARSASCALFDAIVWLGIGTEQRESGSLLSSFASEVVRLKEHLERDPPNALALIDEFARTTTPQEGRALLIAVLRALERRGRLAFASTHLGDVAEAARLTHFAVRGLRNVLGEARGGDLSAALDVLASSMDYSVEEISGESAASADAIELAQLLGLDPDIIADAKESVWAR